MIISLPSIGCGDVFSSSSGSDSWLVSVVRVCIHLTLNIGYSSDANTNSLSMLNLTSNFT